MRIYLDNCSIQRPLDTKSQLRIVLEADAVLGLIELSRTQEVELVTSAVLRFEIRNCQNVVRREYAADVLKAATVDVALTDVIRRRALELEAFGIRPLDSLHIASAEAAGADYFCTCDDGILSKGRSKIAASVKIVSPIELITELGL
jgi:predicted nucleic acid-binding protein